MYNLYSRRASSHLIYIYIAGYTALIFKVKKHHVRLSICHVEISSIFLNYAKFTLNSSFLWKVIEVTVQFEEVLFRRGRRRLRQISKFKVTILLIHFFLTLAIYEELTQQGSFVSSCRHVTRSWRAKLFYHIRNCFQRSRLRKLALEISDQEAVK